MEFKALDDGLTWTGKYGKMDVHFESTEEERIFNSGAYGQLSYVLPPPDPSTGRGPDSEACTSAENVGTSIRPSPLRGDGEPLTGDDLSEINRMMTSVEEEIIDLKKDDWSKLKLSLGFDQTFEELIEADGLDYFEDWTEVVSSALRTKPDEYWVTVHFEAWFDEYGDFTSGSVFKPLAKNICLVPLTYNLMKIFDSDADQIKARSLVDLLRSFLFARSAGFQVQFVVDFLKRLVHATFARKFRPFLVPQESADPTSALQSIERLFTGIQESLRSTDPTLGLEDIENILTLAQAWPEDLTLVEERIESFIDGVEAYVRPEDPNSVEENIMNFATGVRASITPEHPTSVKEMIGKFITGMQALIRYECPTSAEEKIENFITQVKAFIRSKDPTSVEEKIERPRYIYDLHKGPKRELEEDSSTTSSPYSLVRARVALRYSKYLLDMSRLLNQYCLDDAAYCRNKTVGMVVFPCFELEVHLAKFAL